MRNINIEVSSLANQVLNSDFSRWNQEEPTHWDTHQNSGDVISLPFEGGFAVGVIDVDSATETYLTQSIGSDFTVGDRYTLIGTYKGQGIISVDEYTGGAWSSLDSFRFASEDWLSNEINVTIENAVEHRIRLQPEYATNGHDYYYVNIVNFYYSDWYVDRLPLKTDEVYQIENITREIEDDIFEFKSDALTLGVYNYGDIDGYFNTADFISNSNRIFRFDITFDYDADISKSIILFSNNDTIKRIRQPNAVDILQIDLYELSTLFKDNGWFLGKLSEGKYDEDGDLVEEPFFIYPSHNAGSSSYNTNVPIADVVSVLQTDIINLMRQRVIPVQSSDFSIVNNLSGSNNMITIYYNDTIGSAGGKYYVIDAVIAPTGRIFLLLVDNYYDNENLPDGAIRIFELINGTTLTDTGLDINFLGNMDGDLGEDVNVGFVHTYSGATHFSNSQAEGMEIEFALWRQTYATGNYSQKVWAYTNNASSGDDSDFDLVRAGKINDRYGVSASTLQNWKCMYIGANGLLVTTGLTYDPSTDNALWIHNHPIFEGSTLSVVMTFSDTVLYNQEGSGDVFDYAYARSMTVSLPRFLQYYSFKLKNATPSDALKELAITQDAVWYLSYSGSQITVNFVNRDVADDPDEYLSDIDWTYSSEYVKMLKFDNLSSQLFTQDAERMKDFVGYYNNRYGNGRTEIEATIWGWQDYSLRDIVVYNDKTYFIKYVELENYNYATNFRIFELWQ